MGSSLDLFIMQKIDYKGLDTKHFHLIPEHSSFINYTLNELD